MYTIAFTSVAVYEGTILLWAHYHGDRHGLTYVAIEISLERLTNGVCEKSLYTISGRLHSSHTLCERQK